MSIVVDNLAAQAQLDVLRNNRLNACFLYLFTNNLAVAHTNTLGSFTEATGAWYTRNQTATWGAAAAVGDGHYSTTSGPYSYTNSTGSPVTIYGYVVTDPAQTNVEFGELFAAPVTIEPGETWNLTIVYTDIAEF